MSPTERKAAAVKHLTAAGAILTKDSEGRVIAFQLPENVGLRGKSWRHLVQLTDIQDLELPAIHLSNSLIKFLGDKFPDLRSFNLFGNPIDSVAMTYITGMQKLETLYLYRTFIDDEGVKSIAKLKSLKRLNLFDTFLSDEGLKTLGTCKQLEHLCIGNSNIGNFPRSYFTDEGIERLRSDLPDTTIIYWGDKNDQRELPKASGASSRSTSKRKLMPSVATVAVSRAPNLAKRTEGSDWPCFLGVHGDGKSTETNLNLDWNSKQPQKLWSRSIGPGFAAPSVFEGRLMIYHRVRNNDGPARFIERLSCLNCETGASLWEVDFDTDYQDLNGYGDGPRSTPVIDGDRVFVLSPQGILRCLQCVDGKSLWEVDIKSEFECDLVTYGVGTSPLVYGNRLIIVVGGKTKESGKSGVVAFDKRTGIFEYGLGTSPASYATPVIRMAQGRPWCFAFTREGLLSFHPDKGIVDSEFSWRSNIAGSVNAASPVVANEQVLISEAYSNGSALLRFSKNELSPVWQDSKTRRERTLEMHWATPIYSEGFVYGCSGRHSVDAVMKCVEWNTGKVRWEQKMSDRSSMVLIDEHFVCLGENGEMFSFKATPNAYLETGRIDNSKDDVKPSYPAWAAPVVARGLLYVRGKKEIICYDISNK